MVRVLTIRLCRLILHPHHRTVRKDRQLSGPAMSVSPLSRRPLQPPAMLRDGRVIRGIDHDLVLPCGACSAEEALGAQPRTAQTADPPDATGPDKISP